MLNFREEFPEIKHDVVYDLFEEDMRIDDEILKAILSIGDDVVPELELILRKTIDDFEKFSSEGEPYAPVHAIFLLAELESARSLPIILEFLSQRERFLHFWLDDMLTEEIWWVIVKIGKDRLAPLGEFLQDESNYLFAKTAVGKGLSQIGLNYPEKRKDVLDGFEKYLDRVFELDDADEIGIDEEELLSFIISYLLNLKAVELIDKMEEAFDRDLVLQGIVDRRMLRHFESQESLKREINSIFDRYDEIRTWSSFSFEPPEEKPAIPEKKPKMFYENKFDKPFVRKRKKIGRNDPCPCGSGRKYKHCCGR
jgi:uncharacterized protein YecA (UPF0149 family)